MTLAIEPMVNAGAAEVVIADDGWTVSTKDGSLSAHSEHTVAVRRTGPDVLTLPLELLPTRGAIREGAGAQSR